MKRSPIRAEARKFGVCLIGLWVSGAAASSVGCVGEEPVVESPCAEDEVQDHDGSCVAADCGQAPWGNAGSDDAYYVSPDGSDDNDGDEDAPFETLQAAIDVVGDDFRERVVVAAGDYHQNVTLRRHEDGLDIVGRCTELVRVTGDNEEEAGITVLGGRIGIEGITVTKADYTGIAVFQTLGSGVPTVTLRDVVLEGNNGLGLLVAGPDTAVTLESSQIRENLSLADGIFGRGVHVQMGGSLVVRDSHIIDNRSDGLSVMDAGSSLYAEDSVIARTRSDDTDAFGRGVQVQDGASFEGIRLDIDENEELGVYCGQAASCLLTDSTVRNGVGRSDGLFGRGIQVEAGGHFEGSGLIVTGNREAGLVAVDEGSVALVTDSLFEDNAPAVGPGSGGEAVSAILGASMEVRDSTFRRNTNASAYVASAGSLLLVDVVVEDTQGGPIGLGVGLFAELGGLLEAQRVSVTGSKYVAIQGEGSGTLMTLDDVQIADIAWSEETTDVGGVLVFAGAALEATGLEIIDAPAIGIWVGSEGSTAVVSDSQIVGSKEHPVVGGGGMGMIASYGGVIEATGVEITQCVASGTSVVGPGAEAHFVDSRIADGAGDDQGRYGRGLDVYEGGLVTGQGLILESNSDLAVLVSDTDTHVELVDSTISSTARGVEGAGGTGIEVQNGATFAGTGTRFTDNVGPAIVVYSAEGSCTDCSLEGNGFAGAVVLDGRLTLTGGSISASEIHSARGGGVGVFAWDTYGFPAVVLDGVELRDHPGPALYLRGPGSYRLENSTVVDSGYLSGVPGVVMALDGVGSWPGVEDPDDPWPDGFLLRNNTFQGLQNDAVLLHDSGATFDGNSFVEVEGMDYVQKLCEEAPSVVVVGDSPESTSCEGPLVEVDPPLWWTHGDANTSL